MKTTQVLETVKIQQYKTIRFINVLDIPLPERDAFWNFMQGQGIPVIPGFEAVAFAWDWERWKKTVSAVPPPPYAALPNLRFDPF